MARHVKNESNLEARQFARQLRRSSTEAERRLWFLLRNRRVLGHKFRRQVSLGPYVVDFVCFEQRLVIEADGGQHATQRAHDEARTAFLESNGYRVLRFWNNEILTDTDAVLQVVVEALRATPSPQPSPSRGEGG